VGAVALRWTAAGALGLWAAATASAQSGGGYGDYLDWTGWARVVNGDRPGLASSYDRTGGRADYNYYEHPPGLIEGDEDAVVKTIQGPGIVYRFWMPHYTAVRPYEVRLYFDGESEPRLATDSEQLLGGAFSYFREPLVTTFAGGQVSYEPIPFRTSLRIETRNRYGLCHYYQYSYRTFAPGTPVESWDGVLEPQEEAARLATAGLFESAGDHPAGESESAIRAVAGPALVPAGGQLTLVDLAGPGWIRRLTLRLDDATDEELECLRLRAFWDGKPAPAIDAPVGWFFGAGENRVAYRSLPMGTDSPAGFYCYWPMPFRAGARLELANALSHPVAIDSAVVEYEPMPVAPQIGYLHAAARDTTHHSGMTRFTMARAEGSGHYVGNMLFVEQDFDSQYMLEGDEVIVVDQADTLFGTGLEDAYNGGFYYNWWGGMEEPEGIAPSSAIRPLNGILRVERRTVPPFSRADQYRWMIADRVSFTRSFELTMETHYSVSGSRWRSVVFWYQLPRGTTGVQPASPRTRGPDLRLTVPNPIGGAVPLSFTLPCAGPASIRVHDTAGRCVAVISDGPRKAGVQNARWDPGNLEDGVYFIRLETPAGDAERKITVLRR